MLAKMEEHFASRAPTPKGRKALAATYRATMAAMSHAGAHGASLDRIAADAGMTQAALRYHFQTRDELLTAVFTGATVWFRSELERSGWLKGVK